MDEKFYETTTLGVEIINSKRKVKRLTFDINVMLNLINNRSVFKTVPLCTSSYTVAPTGSGSGSGTGTGSGTRRFKIANSATKRESSLPHSVENQITP